MDLSQLLEPERIRCQCDVKSKKRTLQTLAELLGASLRAKQQIPEPSTDKLSDAADAQQSRSGEVGDGSTPKTVKKSGLVNKVRKSAEKSDATTNTETLTDMEILDALISRERLGSTGLGHGVALPHSRLNTISVPVAAFITLEEGVDFESADGKPVDLAVGLLVPEKCNDEHLKILAKLARRFSDEAFRSTLRQFDDAESLYAHLLALPTVSD
ncbi:MAG: PTS sugar transporter subunit IIA [Granulosicoccus sp.]